MIDFLTHQVLVYQQTVEENTPGQRHRALLDELSLYVYSFPGYKNSLSEEDWSDFLLGFLGRIHGILMNFDYRGLSFVCYLNSVLTWHLRSHYRQNQKGQEDEWVCERESIIEYEHIRSDESGCSCDNQFCLLDKLNYILENSGMTPYRKDALRQRLLIFVLKHISFLEEDDYLTAFPFLGPAPEEALRLRRSILGCLRLKYDRKEHLRRKRIENYCRLNLNEKKWANSGDPLQFPLFEKRSKLYRKRLRKLDKQLDSIPLVPSNEDIARLLDMPKGSVDSGLYYLRAYLQGLKRGLGENRISCPD
jgi:hypothetical protein